ncbi:Uncharacterised protein [Vibrio cholerae]|nr:Uncharacterised protein [Vibrio cholerae]
MTWAFALTPLRVQQTHCRDAVGYTRQVTCPAPLIDGLFLRQYRLISWPLFRPSSDRSPLPK